MVFARSAHASTQHRNSQCAQSAINARRTYGRKKEASVYSRFQLSVNIRANLERVVGRRSKSVTKRVQKSSQLTFSITDQWLRNLSD